MNYELLRMQQEIKIYVNKNIYLLAAKKNVKLPRNFEQKSTFDLNNWMLSIFLLHVKGAFYIFLFTGLATWFKLVGERVIPVVWIRNK